MCKHVCVCVYVCMYGMWLFRDCASSKEFNKLKGNRIDFLWLQFANSFGFFLFIGSLEIPCHPLHPHSPLYKYYQIFIPPFLIIAHKSNLHNLKRGFLPSIDAWSPKSGNLGQSNFTNPAVVCCVLLTTLLLSSSSFMLRLPSCLLSSVMVRNIVGVITNNYSILLARAVK